jgi:hypothetical protein
MSYTLHIVISDDTDGESLIVLKETITKTNRSESALALLREPYLISRLLDDAETYKAVKREVFS